MYNDIEYIDEWFKFHKGKKYYTRCMEEKITHNTEDYNSLLNKSDVYMESVGVGVNVISI